MQKITPFLWFDNNAEEAVKLYTSIFKNSRIVSIARYGEAGPGPQGSVMTVDFLLYGQEFVALNGGPVFKEIDELWEKLSEGGEKVQCGWLKDKYGLSWQIVPIELGRMLSDADPEKSKRVMQAMLKMDKIDISSLRRAYDQQ